MNAEQWSRVKDIFHGAIERAPEHREAFVAGACGSDAALRAEVERLIAAHDQAGGFIERSPVAGAAAQTTSLTGRVIGRYEVGRLLGAGGMGEVYAARDAELGRQVALKIATGVDASAQTRLRREAQHASRLNHPHICTIYEVGAADGQSYIVMEYVDGQRLLDAIPPNGLPVETVLRYGIQIADALAHAHRNGVIHRDLKSANIVITSDGRAKVLDFGLSRRDGTHSDQSITQSMTAPGAVSGTLAYMAPELLRGKPADSCSDIWALGVVLHEMAAGTRPFSGDTGFEQSGAILHEPPKPLPARIPAAFQQIVRRCLAKDPRERYQHANEIRSALEIAQVSGSGGIAVPIPVPVAPPVPPAAVPPPPAVVDPAPARGFLRIPPVRWLLRICRRRRWLVWVGLGFLVVAVADEVRTPTVISTFATNARGYSLLEEGHPEEALVEFAKNVKNAPNEPNSYDSLGEAYLVMGEPDTALELYDRALSISPTYSASRTGRAWAWGMMGRFDQAIADDPPDSFVKALLLSRVGRYDESQEILADEDKEASAMLLSSMLAIERGNQAEALQHVRDAEKVLEDESKEAKRVSLVLADLLAGTAAARSGDLKVARDRLASQGKLYKATDPTEKWWHQTLAGEIALASGDPQSALDAYAAGEPSRKLWPNLRDTSTVIFANSLSVRDLPARAQAARGDVDGAIQTYRRLLTTGPEQKRAAVYEPRYDLAMARLLIKAGKRDEAKQEYQKFLDFWKNADPGLPEVAEARSVVTGH